MRINRPKTDTILENGKERTTVSQPFKDAKTTIFGAYIGDDIYLADDWQLLLGMRYDKNELEASNSDYPDNSSDKVTGSANLVYQSDNGIKSYLAYAQGYRAAPYDKVYGNIPHLFALPPFEITPNPELGPETSESIEYGISWSNDQWQLASSVYYTKYNDFIDWVEKGLRQSDGVYERQFVNVEQAYIYGAEFEANYQFNTAFDVNLSLGWMDGENKSKDEPLRNLTPFEYNLSANYEWQDMRFSAYVYGQQSMSKVPNCADPFLGSLGKCRGAESWLVTDLTWQYQITPSLVTNVALNNLFDKEYTRYQDIAGLAVSALDVSQPGRNFSASIRYTF